jgi:hypothetical protein
MESMTLEMRQKFAQWLLRGVHVKDVHFGDHSITLSPVAVGDVIAWAPAAGPATTATGQIGMSAEGPTCFPGSQAATATLAAYGGQSLGANVTLGTRDAFAVGIKTNNVEALRLQSGTGAAPGIAGFATTTPNTQSQLHIGGPSGGAGPAQTSAYTAGSARALLIPRYAADGSFTSVLDANDEGLLYYNTATQQFRYWDGVALAWVGLATTVTTGWLVGGNVGTPNPGIFGTLDAKDISVETNGIEVLRYKSSTSATNPGFIGINQSAPTAHLEVDQGTGVTGSPSIFRVVGAANTTNFTASVEAIDADFNLSRTVTFATGAIATQRAVRITPPTYAFAGASTITTAATLAVTGVPVAGANATITNGYAILSGGLLGVVFAAGVTGLAVFQNTTGAAADAILGVANTALFGTLGLRGASSDIFVKAAAAGAGFRMEAFGAGSTVMFRFTGSADAVNFPTITRGAFAAPHTYSLPDTTANGFFMIFGGAVTATIGSIPFAIASGAYAQNNANLFWDNANLRLGVGTNAPAATAHIVEPAAVAGSPIAFEVTGGAHTTLANASLTDIELDLSNTAQFTGGGAAIPVADAVLVLARNYTAVAAQTISRAATVEINDAPVAIAPLTITNAYALLVSAGRSAFGGVVIPLADLLTSVGTSSLRWSSINAGPTGFEAWNTAGAANPGAQIGTDGTNGQVLLGPGGATAPDVRLIRAASFAAAGVIGPTPVPAATYHQLVVDCPLGAPGDVVAVVPTTVGMPLLSPGLGSIGSDPGVLGGGAPLIKWTLVRAFAGVFGDVVMIDSEGKAHWALQEAPDGIHAMNHITGKLYKFVMEEVKNPPKGLKFCRGTHK